MKNIKIEGDLAKIIINPKVYSLESIYSAAYVFLDKAYIVLDGDPKKEILINIKPKGEDDPEKVGMEFLNELINYSDYETRAEKTRKIREVLLQRALITNDPSLIENKEDDLEFDKLKEELDEDDFLDDPEGIAIPWEEKYGKKDETKTE